MADLALLDGYRAVGEQAAYDGGALRPYLIEAVDAQVCRELAMRWESPVEVVPDEPGDPFEDIVIGALQLDAILADLPPDQRDVLRLRFVEDLTSDEVGRRLQKADGAVRQLQLRAIRRLRRTLFAAVVLAVAVVGSLVLILRDAPVAQVDEAPADRSSLPGPTTEPTIVEREPEIEEESSVRPEPLSTNPDGPAIVEGLDAARFGSSSIDSPTTTDPVIDPPTSPPSTTASPPSTTASPPATTGPSSSTTFLPTTTPNPPAAGPDPGLAIVADPPAGHSAVYDGFGASAGNGRGDGGRGFVRRSSWSVELGRATIESDPVGLSYTDRAGAVLATTPGAIRVSDPVDSTRLSRPLIETPGGNEVYWVSYLLRLDSPTFGDAFWTPDGVHDVGAAGLQQHPFHRFVNRRPSSVLVVPGATTLLVLEIRPDGASLWIDPSLTSPGPPTIELAEPPSPLDGMLRFKFNGLGDGVYTIDEVRLGVGFDQVAPAR